MAEPAQATPSAQTAPLPEALLRAQAIDCGAASIAVPFSWARVVVEDFHVSPAPNSPVWLAGAANVDGHILPVLDLAAWLDEQAAQTIDRDSKLLVGGEGDERFALLFRKQPVMVRYPPGAQAPGTGTAAGTGTGLTKHTFATASLYIEGDERRWPVIDAHALGERWLSELAI